MRISKVSYSNLPKQLQYNQSGPMLYVESVPDFLSFFLLEQLPYTKSTHGTLN